MARKRHIIRVDSRWWEDTGGFQAYCYTSGCRWAGHWIPVTDGGTDGAQNAAIAEGDEHVKSAKKAADRD